MSTSRYGPDYVSDVVKYTDGWKETMAQGAEDLDMQWARSTQQSPPKHVDTELLKRLLEVERICINIGYFQSASTIREAHAALRAISGDTSNG